MQKSIPVIEHVTPAPVVNFTAPVPVMKDTTPAPAVTFEYVPESAERVRQHAVEQIVEQSLIPHERLLQRTDIPAMEYIAPAPPVTDSLPMSLYLQPSQAFLSGSWSRSLLLPLRKV